MPKVENLNIEETSLVRLNINGNESRWLEFSPDDLTIYKRLKNLYNSLSTKFKEYESAEIEARGLEGEDENGVSLAGLALVDVQADFADFTRKGLDDIFGAGTCERLFGMRFVPEEYSQFLLGILGYIGGAREAKVKKKLNRQVNKKVMS